MATTVRVSWLGFVLAPTPQEKMMKELALKLQTKGMLLVIPGAASLREAGAIPTAALCAALLMIAGIHLLKSAEAKPAT